MFESARWKLTAWYLAIIMAISILFSFVIYAGINNEFRRFERMELRLQDGRDVPLPSFVRPQRIVRPDPKIIQQARERFIVTLGLVNMLIFWLAGLAGYFLAGRTLRPIKHMVDEQNRF